MNLAIRVALRREELGLSQEDLAMKMGYKSRSSINKIENGRPVTQKIIFKLAEALNTTPAYLMGLDEEYESFVPSDDAELLLMFHKLTQEQQESVMNLIKSMIK